MGWRNISPDKLKEAIAATVQKLVGQEFDNEDALADAVHGNYPFETPESDDEWEEFYAEGSPFQQYEMGVLQGIEPEQVSWESSDSNGDGDKDMAVVDANGDGSPDFVASTADSDKEDKAAQKKAKELSEDSEISSTGKTKGELSDKETLSDAECKRREAILGHQLTAEQEADIRRRQQGISDPYDVAWTREERNKDMQDNWGKRRSLSDLKPDLPDISLDASNPFSMEARRRRMMERGPKGRYQSDTVSDETQKNVLCALLEHRL